MASRQGRKWAGTSPARGARGATVKSSFAVALVAVCILALAACGAGFGPGESAGEAELLVTRDFGSETLVRADAEPLTESDTVMRLLDRSADIETRYGGGFVQSIEGLGGGDQGGRPYDWFFFVNGIEADRGGADYQLSESDRVWWDYRDWGASMRAPAVVGLFPEPFVHGYAGKAWPAEVECLGAEQTCKAVAEALLRAGANLDPAGDAIRVLVGPWDEVGRDADGARFGRGPQVSGVYLRAMGADAAARAPGADGAGAGARGAGTEFTGLDARGEQAARFGAGYGLVAATRRGDGPPVWVVTGTDQAGVDAAAGSLDRESLHGNYAVIAGPGGPVPLPVR